MARANATAPGWSPWRQSVSGDTGMGFPESEVTTRFSTIATARSAATAASSIIAPGVPRGASVPSSA
jgi:hypothetical protein